MFNSELEKMIEDIKKHNPDAIDMLRSYVFFLLVEYSEDVEGMSEFVRFTWHLLANKSDFEFFSSALSQAKNNNEGSKDA